MKFSKTMICFAVVLACASMVLAKPPPKVYKPNIQYGPKKGPVYHIRPEVEAGAYGYTDGGFKYGGYVEEDNYNYAATNSYNPYGYGRSKQGLKVIGGGGVHGHIGHKTNAEMDHDYYPMEHEASEYGYAKLQGGYYDKAKGTLYSDGTSKVTPTGAVAGHKMSGNLYSTGYGRVQTAGGATAKSEDDYY